MTRRAEILILAGAALAPAACSAVESPAPDPAAGPILLEAKSGFRAQLLHAGDVGVWTVGAADVLPAYAGDEVVGLDDEGRVIVLVRYSGRTLARFAVMDGTWLGGLAHGDV
ncbi:MAG: hypothetical protein O7B99_15115, partial [Planctomycetota bacterium]|nr:hypothetical protein [Planctomycetota bacterium]